MKDCRWLTPVLVAQIEFLEWTGENHFRHTKFIALRDDKSARGPKGLASDVYRLREQQRQECVREGSPKD
jgi:ATP-dependent DNA ligase